MKKFLPFISVLLFSTAIYSQNGYYIEPQTIQLPDTSVFEDAIELPIPVNREDVKAVGMGKTQVANGKRLNGMIYNPALLGNRKFDLEVLSVQAVLPPQTYEAADYLNTHIDEFRSALSLKEVWRGIEDFNLATAQNNIQAQIAAVKRIQQGLKFPKELLSNVIGSTDDPKTHGLRVIPAISVQAGNFGFSLYGVAQSGFEVQQSPIVDALLQVEIPDDINDPGQLVNAILSLQGILQAVSNFGENDLEEILPVTLSVGFIDIVGAAGYGYNVTPQLSLGANLKVVHRRFSVKRIVTVDYKDIINVIKQDLNKSITGVTADLGALYKFPTGTEVGLAIQNIIPVQKITSTLDVDFAVSELFYRTDQFGNKVINQNGDTVLVNVAQNIKVNLPFDLKLPIMINAGAIHPITPHWDVALDWADIAAQDVRYENYLERLRVGTEYRLDAVEDMLGIAFRVGMADTRFTGGIGLNIYKALQLDGAYAYDNFVGEYSYFAQVRLGW